MSQNTAAQRNSEKYQLFPFVYKRTAKNIISIIHICIRNNSRKNTENKALVENVSIYKKAITALLYLQKAGFAHRESFSTSFAQTV